MSIQTKAKERPILFTGPMVRGILVDCKTETRRILKRQPLNPRGPNYDGLWSDTIATVTRYFTCPQGQPGERLWVKETHWRYGIWRKNGLSGTGRQKWKFWALTHDLGVQFSAPAAPPKHGRKGWHKRPSIFMPRAASRITLEIVSVRVERLNWMKDKNAKAEGCAGVCFATFGVPSFRYVWESIHGAGSWGRNPWVWVIGFKRLENPEPAEARRRESALCRDAATEVKG